MKKYPILVLISLIALNLCARSNVQGFVDRIGDTLEFGYDSKKVQDVFASLNDDATIDMFESIINNYPIKDMFEFIIDDYMEQIKNPYAKYMIEVFGQKINITLLDFALLNEAAVRYNAQMYKPDSNKEAKEAELLITLLKDRHFKQTISNNKLECVVVCLEGECPDCVACELKHMGLK